MSIIDQTYYTKDINLTDDQITKMFATWQASYEESIIRKLLGYTLYALYNDDLDKTGSIDNPVSDRFKALVDGAEFSFAINGETVNAKFSGLRNSVFKKSLVGYYAYYMYRNEVESFNSGAGQVISNVENSEKTNIMPLLVSTWNKMINWYGKTPDRLNYIEYFLNNGNYSHYNTLPSAYNFLLANKETYPEWVFEPIADQNIWGI